MNESLRISKFVAAEEVWRMRALLEWCSLVRLSEVPSILTVP